MNAEAEPSASVPGAPEEDVTTTLYRAAIGPVGIDTYLPLFTRFEAADRAGIAWNTAAALLTLNWLIFRRLWLPALIYGATVLALTLLIFGIGPMLLQFPDALVQALALGFGVLAVVLPGLFGNAVFHRDCRKRMGQALVDNRDLSHACADLARQAATQKRAMVLAAINGALVVLLLLGVLQWNRDGVVQQDAPAAPLATAAGPVTPASASAVAASTPAPVASAPAIGSSAPPTVPSASTATLAPLVAVPASMPASPAAPARAPASTAAAAAVSAPTQKPRALPAPAPAAPPLPAPKPVAATMVRPNAALAPSPERAYYLDVGMFAVPQNAEKARQRLEQAQLAVIRTEVPSATHGKLSRIRVGPFATQAQAQAAAIKVRALQLEAVVTQRR